MKIIEAKVWKEVPLGIPFFVVLTDDPAVALKRFVDRWGYKPDLAYKINGKFWLAKRDDYGTSEN